MISMTVRRATGKPRSAPRTAARRCTSASRSGTPRGSVQTEEGPANELPRAIVEAWAGFRARARPGGAPEAGGLGVGGPGTVLSLIGPKEAPVPARLRLGATGSADVVGRATATATAALPVEGLRSSHGRGRPGPTNSLVTDVVSQQLQLVDEIPPAFVNSARGGAAWSSAPAPFADGQRGPPSSATCPRPASVRPRRRVGPRSPSSVGVTPLMSRPPRPFPGFQLRHRSETPPPS